MQLFLANLRLHHCIYSCICLEIVLFLLGVA